MQARMTAAELADGLSTMSAEIVPQDDDVTTEVTEQVAEECAHLGLADVLAIELVVQPQPAAARTHGDAGDDRDPIMTVAMVNNGGMASGGPGAADTGDQEEARFVGEDEVGAQPRGVFFTRGHSLRFQRSIFASSRSRARRSGFWWLHPS